MLLHSDTTATWAWSGQPMQLPWRAYGEPNKSRIAVQPRRQKAPASRRRRWRTACPRALKTVYILDQDYLLGQALQRETKS